MGRQRVPLRERHIDLLIMAFFALNLVLISYVVDLEQLVFPMLIIARMNGAYHPFTRASASRTEGVSPMARSGGQA